MKLTYLGTAAAEGIPALFCECEACRRARALGAAGIHTRSGADRKSTRLNSSHPTTSRMPSSA